jgi:hypothetical protein
VAGTRRLLQRFLDLDADHRHAMADAAHALFEQRYSIDAMALSLIEVAKHLSGTAVLANGAQGHLT